jgi:hypothetical protein
MDFPRVRLGERIVMRHQHRMATSRAVHRDTNGRPFDHDSLPALRALEFDVRTGCSQRVPHT